MAGLKLGLILLGCRLIELMAGFVLISGCRLGLCVGWLLTVLRFGLGLLG